MNPVVQQSLATASRSAPIGNIAHMVTGPLSSPVGGRTDHLPISVPSGAYVIPADIVSAIGEGNTQNGIAVLNRTFGIGAPQNAPTAVPTKPVDIMAAGGEFVVPPAVVVKLGGGNIRQGHAVLDAFVKRVRAANISKLRSMPKPVGARR